MNISAACRLAAFKPVHFTYKELQSDIDLTHKIEEAYGQKGLGILTVTDIPEYQDKRIDLLKLARRLALLPQSEINKLMLPQVNHAIGWSLGTESFKGTHESCKASFRANVERDEALTKIGAFHDNVWPDSLPELKPAFKSLGMKVIEVGNLLAKHVDRYIKHHCLDYQDGTFQDIVKNHKNVVGRLLHYYPKEATSPWCEWHCDFSGITGLTSPIYLDQITGEIVHDGELDDSNSGLFIKNRDGDVLKAEIKPEMLCFQVGEVTQVMSGGRLRPTPHAVLAGGLQGVSRNTLAVFLAPKPDFIMSAPKEHSLIFEDYEGVPHIKNRWNDGMTFGAFKTTSFKYYSYTT